LYGGPLRCKQGDRPGRSRTPPRRSPKNTTLDQGRLIHRASLRIAEDVALREWEGNIHRPAPRPAVVFAARPRRARVPNPVGAERDCATPRTRSKKMRCIKQWRASLAAEPSKKGVPRVAGLTRSPDGLTSLVVQRTRPRLGEESTLHQFNSKVCLVPGDRRGAQTAADAIARRLTDGVNPPGHRVVTAWYSASQSARRPAWRADPSARLPQAHLHAS
jgi:hypothetical protein